MALIALLSASRLPAQPVVTIEGTVLDSNSGSPIPGAKVTLCYSASARALRTVFADAAGRFRLPVTEPGTYEVMAGAEGYQEGRGGSAVAVDAAALDPVRAHHVRTVTIELRRAAAIEGRIRDGDTREAMPLLIVKAVRVWWSEGLRRFTEERTGFTDDHGSFRFDELPAGEYLLEIRKRTWEGDAPDDSPRRYPTLLWPDSRPDTLDPIHLSDGGEFKAGTIDYSRQSFPRVAVHVTSNCPEDGTYELSISQKLGGSLVRRESRKGSCSTPVVIDSLAPGSYRFQIRTSERPFAIGVTERQLREGTDIDLAIQPSAIATMTGKIICSCKPSAARPYTVVVQYLDDGGGRTNLSARNDGSFLGGFVFPGTVRIDVPRFTVTKVVYNGVEAGQFLAINPEIPSTLEITVSDREAAVSGAVTKDGKPVARGCVAIGRWPLVPDETYPDFRSAQTAEKGDFLIANLAPGTYRIASLSPGEWARRNEPNVVASALASGQELRLAEDQTATVALERR